MKTLQFATSFHLVCLIFLRSKTFKEYRSLKTENGRQFGTLKAVVPNDKHTQDFSTKDLCAKLRYNGSMLDSYNRTIILVFPK